jgi:hypothetical protein
MVDFIKSFNGAVTIDDYMWKYSIPMIKIMGMDNSHVNYLSEKQAKTHRTHDLLRGATNAEELYTDLGTPVNFGK